MSQSAKFQQNMLFFSKGRIVHDRLCLHSFNFSHLVPVKHDLEMLIYKNRYHLYDTKFFNVLYNE